MIPSSVGRHLWLVCLLLLLWRQVSAQCNGWQNPSGASCGIDPNAIDVNTDGSVNAGLFTVDYITADGCPDVLMAWSGPALSSGLLLFACQTVPPPAYDRQAIVASFDDPALDDYPVDDAQLAQTFLVRGEPVVADINGDGALDALVTVAVVLNSPDWFGVEWWSQSPSGWVLADTFFGLNRPQGDAVLADIDGDGFVDLVLSADRGFIVWFNTGLASTPFIAGVDEYLIQLGVGATFFAPTRPVLADFDQDGALDVAVPSAEFIHLVYGSFGSRADFFSANSPSLLSAFPGETYANSPHIYAVHADDDGFIDLVLHDGSGQAFVTHLNPHARLEPDYGNTDWPWWSPEKAWLFDSNGDPLLLQTMAFGDLDADGDSDLYILPPQQQGNAWAIVMLNNWNCSVETGDCEGDGGWTLLRTPVRLERSWQPISAHIRDIDGDGYGDIFAPDLYRNTHTNL